MKNTRIIRRIIRGVIAEHEFTRLHMDKMNKRLALSAEAFAELGNATYRAGEAIGELAKALETKGGE